MRKTLQKLIEENLSGMQEIEMQSLADAMGVSLATAYRYRKSPLDMTLKSFVSLVGHKELHMDMSVTLHQEELIEAELLRLNLEESIAENGGYRTVTTPHFSVNCELPEITRIKFKDRYDKKHWDKMDKFIALRKKRRDLYLSEKYLSKEIINGDAYIDFFLRRNLFQGMDEKVWKKQYIAILETNELSTVERYIYMRSTPELPVILCYSSGDTILRLSDLTLSLSKDHFSKIEKTMMKYIDKCIYKNKEDVRSFLIDPIKFRY